MKSPIRRNENNRESIKDLLRGIFQDARALSSQELLAAKLEIKEEINKAVRSAISFGAGGFVLAVGVILLSFMLVFLVDTYTELPLWASCGVVGLLYVIVGGLLIWSGKRTAGSVEPFPSESVESVKKDIRTIRAASAEHA